MKPWLPVLAWLLWLLLVGPDFLNSHWDSALVLFAAGMLVPKGLSLLQLPPRTFYWIAALLFGAAYCSGRFPAEWRALMALPYVGLALWLTVRETTQLFVLPKIQLVDMVRVAALAYWSTGAVFAICFLSNMRPLGFQPVIVSLTAAHFHVAGFVLTTIAYCMLSTAPSPMTRLTGWIVLAGMPSVATGIVLTEWGYNPVLEWVPALLFVLFAAIIVGWHINRVFDKNEPLATRRYWFFGAICLLSGLVLAALYALRFVYPMAWFNIPNMKIWHGTLNTIGFGWLTLIGWECRKNLQSRTILP